MHARTAFQFEGAHHLPLLSLHRRPLSPALPAPDVSVAATFSVSDALVVPETSPVDAATNVIVSSPSAEMHPDMSCPVCDTLPSILRVTVPIFRYVTKGARDAWAGIVGEAISSAPPNLTAWCKLFMLARCIFTSQSCQGWTFALA